MAENNYHDQVNKENIVRLRNLIDQLPRFCRTYFIGIQERTAPRTRLGYAYDLTVFFKYLHNENPACSKMEITEFPLSILDQIKRQDIEEYLNYVSYYESEGKEITNEERGKARKLSALKSLYNYFYKSEQISTNPASLVDAPKLHEKQIVRLEPNEVAKLLDLVEYGENLTEKERAYHKKTRLRDTAILTLLLGTGMRVSECVGIDIKNVDFDTGGILVRRKGGNEAIIYFGDEVECALLDYLDERKNILPKQGHEDALFLSMQNTRMSVRAIEKLVKKYASKVTTLKKITPHKLRSTYGTTLYNETGDIYLVADVLGHKDVNTTRKHYANQDEDRKRRAANIVKLREY